MLFFFTFKGHHHFVAIMAALNVNRNVSDVFYRYKMPRLLAKVEGKGNGIKTGMLRKIDCL